jgi:hypothetical protein
LAVEADGIMELLRKEAEERVGGRPKKDEGKPRQIFDEVSSDNERRSEHKAAEIFGTNRTYVNQAAKFRRIDATHQRKQAWTRQDFIGLL